jgi:hypothetical protein
MKQSRGCKVSLDCFAALAMTALGPTATSRQFIVGIENSAPSLTPDDQREVTVLVLV